MAENENRNKPAGADRPQKSEPLQEKQEPETGQLSKDARLWAMFCHLAGLAGFAFPFGNIILPLIFWQIKKEEFPFVAEQGKEAVNFQISMTIYMLICIPMTFLCIGMFLMAAVIIVDVVLLIIAAVKANNGQPYRYPLTIRLIK